METSKPEVHILGGTRFLAIGDSTAQQDLHFMALVKRAGIDDITMQEGEDPEHFARRLLELTIASGATLDILGALLIPENRVKDQAHPGDDWSLETAAETASLLGKLKDRKDKAELHSLILSLLISFFEYGIVSLWITPTSSNEAIPQKNGAEKADMATGPSSSSQSPRAIGVVPNP